MDFAHTPVLQKEAIEALNVLVGKKYIDSTLGGGGHTALILENGGLVLGIDQDEEAIDYVKQTQELRILNKKLKVVKGNFRDISRIAKDNNFINVDGILFDLGVSSHQLNKPERGFGFKSSEKLDMRMDQSRALSAYEVVNKYSYGKLVEIFYRYAEEHNAKEIAREIVEKRKTNPIKTPVELAGLIEKISHKPGNVHPATRVFQAIRIEVNDEIEALRDGLINSVGLLKKKGRIVVISFHSLEDRVTKQMFAKFEKEKLGKVITKKPLTATFEENKKNRRARSAKMRVFEAQIT